MMNSRYCNSTLNLKKYIIKLGNLNWQEKPVNISWLLRVCVLLVLKIQNSWVIVKNVLDGISVWKAGWFWVEGLNVSFHRLWEPGWGLSKLQGKPTQGCVWKQKYWWRKSLTELQSSWANTNNTFARDGHILLFGTCRNENSPLGVPAVKLIGTHLLWSRAPCECRAPRIHGGSLFTLLEGNFSLWHCTLPW